MIDIRDLRIGSHVLVDGKRERVRGLDEDNGLIIRFPAEYVNASEVEPIPITPELLTELDYVQKRMDYPYGKPNIWYVDPESAKLMKDNLVVSTVSIWSMDMIGYPDWWRIKVLAGDKLLRDGEFYCRYLHEAESFLALHDVELITE